MADWLQPTFLLFPFAAWMFLGVGIPWALALLPRPLWSERITVIAVGMALGPLGLTAVMFTLGTWARITLGGTLAASALLAAVGTGMAWRRWAQQVAPLQTDAGSVGVYGHTPLQARITRFEWLLIAAMVLILAINVITTAYWPFLAYDPLWVYGYNAKIFVAQQHIPDSTGYYPQLLPLGYTYMQQAWGGINDHAARVIVPWFNTAMVLMAYTLGRRAFGSRRIGLLAAAVWTFYPHVAAWSGAGDLEIPMTLYVTGSAALFIEAWRSDSRRAAVLSGVLLAGGLWTKPTAGALALGMGLAVVGWGVIVRWRWAAWWPKCQIALVAGLASAPLGGMWYLRNTLLGHTAVVFPAGYWHSLAQRSGQEFGWPILIAALVAGGLLAHPPAWLRAKRRGVPIGLPLLALALLLAGALPTALNPNQIVRGDNLWRWARGDLSAGGRLSAPEALLIAAGCALLAWLVRARWRALTPERRTALLLIWALLLPYGVVWFFDFSYHYRLSFAIVPLLAVQAAALIDGWAWDWCAAGRARRAAGVALTAGVIALAAAAGVQFSAKYWLKGGLPDDAAKYDEGNPALMGVVHMLERYAQDTGHPPSVVIPGEDRLPFFFPTWDIRHSREPDDLPTRLEDLDGADIFIDSSVGVFLVQRAGRWPNMLLADAAVGAAYHRVHAVQQDGTLWPTVLQPIPLSPDGSLPVDDGNFRFAAYTVHPEARTALLEPNAPRQDTVIIGGFAQFVGYDVVTLDWYRGQNITLTLYWRPTDAAPPPQDYSIYIHLLDADGTWIAGWDGVPLQGQYPTRYWRPGESLLDYWTFRVPEDVPAGPAQVRIGIYDPIANQRLPVVIDGAAAGDGLTINTQIAVR